MDYSPGIAIKIKLENTETKKWPLLPRNLKDWKDAILGCLGGTLQAKGQLGKFPWPPPSVHSLGFTCLMVGTDQLFPRVSANMWKLSIQWNWLGAFMCFEFLG